MAEHKASTRGRHVPDAPADEERVSLAGAPFTDVLRGLLAVDPKDLDDEQGTDDGPTPRD